MNRRTFLRSLASAALLASTSIRIPLFSSPPGGTWIRVDKWLAGFKPKTRPNKVCIRYKREIVLGLHEDFLNDYQEAIRRFRQFKDTKGVPWRSAP